MARLAGWRRGVVLPESDRLLAAVMLASCLVVPLLFVTALEDTFALPKVTALRLILIVALALLTVGFLRGRRGLAVSTLDVLVLTFVALNVLAYAFSIDRRQSLMGERLQYQGLLTILTYVGFFYLAVRSLGEERRVRLLFASVAAGGTGVAAYALVQKAGLDPIAWSYSPQERVFSSIGQPNALAAYLVLAIPVSASLLAKSQPLARGVVAMCLGLMVAALALTLSRGGYAGFIAVAAIVAIPLARSLRLNPRGLLYGLVPGVAAVIVVAALVQPVRATATEVWTRALSSTDTGDSSLQMHRDLWVVGANIALDNPFLGTGQETYPELFPRYADSTLGEARASIWSAYRPESPHNVYLAIASGAGFPTLVVYMAFLGSFSYFVLKALKGMRESEWRRIALIALLAAVVGHAVTDMFMTAEVTGSWLFWLLMGAGVGLARAKPGEQAELGNARGAVGT